MNSLSWFLYFADVIGNVQGLLVAIALGAVIVTVISCIIFFTEQGSYGDPALVRISSRFATAASVTCILSALTAAIIPTTQTLYLIAGSEAGETVVTSPEGKEILSDIKDVIKHQLTVLKGNENE